MTNHNVKIYLLQFKLASYWGKVFLYVV